MAKVFGGVKKMLEGKKFLPNFRALRMVAEELFCGVINPEDFETRDEMIDYLEETLNRRQCRFGLTTYSNYYSLQ